MDTNTENNDDVKIKKTKREKSIPGRLRGKGKSHLRKRKVYNLIILKLP